MSNTIAKPKNYNNSQTDYMVHTGQKFDSFISHLPEMSQDEIDNIIKSTIEILSKCVPPSYNEDIPVSNTGLVLGYVQSGKTMSFTGLITLASDNNYKFIIVLAGTTRILLNQTIERLMDDLNDRNSFEIISESNTLYKDPNTIANIIVNPHRNKTVILTILKHHKHIKHLSNILDNIELKNALFRKSILIIDDEADQASLNGMARKNWKLDQKSKNLTDEEKQLHSFTTTYSNILELKSKLDCHSYIQYTATPQANILAAQRDLLRPSWAVVLEPGNKYTGGKVFFNDTSDLIVEIKNEIEDEDPEMPNELIDAFLLFLVESALLTCEYKNINRLRKKMTRTSMMVHADRLIEKNSIYMRWLVAYSKTIRLGIDSNEEEIVINIKKYYEKVKILLTNYFDIFPVYEEVYQNIRYFVLDEIRFWFVAGDGDSQVQWDQGNHHVLIGGQKLDRGFTVKELITTYLPRQTKSISNADTIEQRCRFFGYKKEYIEACKVFLPKQSIDEFSEYIFHEEKLRDLLRTGNIQDYYNNNTLMRLFGLNPTSINKIPGNIIRNDFFSYKFLEPDLENLDETNQLITSFINDSSFKGELSYSKAVDEISTDNLHRVSISNVKSLKGLLTKIKVNRIKDKMILDQFIALLGDINYDLKVWLIEMAYKRDGYRPRSIKETGELKALFTNHPPEFGDTKLLMDKIAGGQFYSDYKNEIIVQVHKVKIKDVKNEDSIYKAYSGKVFYIIAFRYPDEKTSNYINVQYD